MNIAILVIVSSIIGLVGFFIDNSMMFYIGGTISLLDLIRYLALKTIEEDKAKIQEIKKTRFYQRKKNSIIYRAENEEELKGIIKQFIISNVFGYIIIYSLGCGLLFYFFSYKAFIWAGIVVGLGYNLSIIPKLLHKK
jgi:hypothetical protein